MNKTIIMYQPGRCETNRRYIITRQFRKISHSLYEFKYHVIFYPKYRYKILQKEISSYITRQIYRLSSQKEGIEVLGLNVQPEHIHLIVSIPPKYAVSQYMGFLKGKLALNLFDRYPELRKRYWGQHLWSRGYCVSTVGLDEERIIKYVKWQPNKDQKSDSNQDNLFN
ncbi:MAG: IS200/IS605 family transposase [Desulfamplus sp.]